MINLTSLYTSQRWFLTSRFLNISVTVRTDPVSTISLQYSERTLAFSAAQETEFHQNHCHIIPQHHCIHYRSHFLLRLWEGDFLIWCMFWNLPDLIDLQGLVVYFSVMRYVLIEAWFCTCSQAFLDSRVYIEYGCFFFDIFPKEVKFLIISHFFSVLTVLFAIFCASAAHRFSDCNDVFRLSLCLRKMPSLNPKK